MDSQGTDMDAYPFPRLYSYRQNHLFSERVDMEDETSISSSVETEMRRRRSGGPSAMTKLVMGIGVVFVLILCLRATRPSRPIDSIPFSQNAIEDYFEHFEGHQECDIRSSSLYQISKRETNKPTHPVLCPNRKRLLEALSGGGRHGFDAPYSPIGCHFRWYTAAEVCMILERFDGVVFLGDDMLKTIYAAFNMLLRENIAFGGLKQWDLDEHERDKCHCDNQLTQANCIKNLVMESEDVAANDADSAGHRAPYYCNRIPHFFLPISGSPAPAELHDRFATVLKNDADSYKPIPVILTLGLSTSLSWPLATASMDEWLGLADASGRNVPFLWVGPNAAGHLKPPGQILNQGNNALWHYTVEMAKEAHSREVDALGMYNMTLQASSWDGSGYGLKVVLVQAMMIINWLARVDST